MIKEKLQQVGHDMGSLVEKQHIYLGHYQTLGIRISAISLPVMLGSGHTAIGGHSTNTAANMIGS